MLRFSGEKCAKMGLKLWPNCDNSNFAQKLTPNPWIFTFYYIFINKYFWNFEKLEIFFQKVAKKNVEVNNGKILTKWNTEPMFQVPHLSYGKSDLIDRNSLVFLEFVMLMKDRSQIERYVVNIYKIWPKCDKIQRKSLSHFKMWQTVEIVTNCD